MKKRIYLSLDEFMNAQGDRFEHSKLVNSIGWLPIWLAAPVVLAFALLEMIASVIYYFLWVKPRAPGALRSVLRWIFLPANKQ